MTFIVPPNSLSDIRQRHGETLTSYLGRFNDKLENVKRTTDDVVMSFLIAMTHRGTDFWKDIAKENPKTLNVVYIIVETYKRLEDNTTSNKKPSTKSKEKVMTVDRGSNIGNRGQNSQSPKRGSSEHTSRQSRSPRRPYNGKYESYSELTTSRGICSKCPKTWSASTFPPQ